MRQKRNMQLTFQDVKPNWSNSRQWQKIDEILNDTPEVFDLVYNDLLKADEQAGRRGAPGMSAEQVLKVAIVQKIEGLPYRKLWDRIDDSERFRSFCRFGDEEIPSFTILAANIKRISCESWEVINRILVRYAKAQGVESGDKVRIDCTGVESNIHHPTDSRLLGDVVRVCTRLIVACRESFADAVGRFPNRQRAVKKRVFKIANAKSEATRQQLYKELFKLTDEVIRNAETMTENLEALDTSKVWDGALLTSILHQELKEVIGHGHTVMSQARRRVLEGETVPSEEKIVSIFEPHTDIIKKGGREPLFGHKVCVAGGASNMILDCCILEGNPKDSDLFIDTVNRTINNTGTVPLQLSADDGFSSFINGNTAKEIGIQEVAFGGKLKIELTHWVSSERVQKKLRRFRAGIEATISATKRAFGLDRCTWKGWEGFCKYVWAAITAWNLQVLARHLMKT